jgi:hypothetical protein
MDFSKFGIGAGGGQGARSASNECMMGVTLSS